MAKMYFLSNSFLLGSSEIVHPIESNNCRTIKSPKPLPSPFGFVDINGSNNCFSIFLGIPKPLSEIYNHGCSMVIFILGEKSLCFDFFSLSQYSEFIRILSII